MVLFLLPAATFSFGGVHLWSRLCLTVLMVACGANLALRGRFGDHRHVLWLVLAILGLSALPLIPVNGFWRGFFHGDLAAPVQDVFDLLGRSARPLALEPSGALLGWTEAVALFLLGLGVTSWCTRAARVQMLQRVMVGTGVAVVATMGAHMLLGLDSVYGTGVGLLAREGTYGPFVNPNHAGMFCAAILAIAVTGLRMGPISHRIGALFGVSVLGFGVWSSGSRGAVVSALVGLAITTAIAGGRVARMMVACVLIFSVLAASILDLETVVRGLGEWVAPSVNQMVDAGYVDITTGRLSLWSDTLDIVSSAWLLGVGAGGFDQAYRMVRSDPGFNISTHAHNEPLQLLAEQGVAVLLLVVCLFWFLLRVARTGALVWSNRPDRTLMMAGFLGCLGSLFTAGFVSFPFRLHSHALLFVMSMGAVIGLSRPQKGGRSVGQRLRTMIWVMVALALGGTAVVAHGDIEPFARGARAYDSGTAWFEAASGESQAGRKTALESSAKHFERAIVRNLDRRSFQWLARARVGMGDLHGADAVLAAATQTYPTMPWIWRDRARLAQRMGAGELARESWNRMLTQDLPGTVEPTDVLHEALFGGDFERPIEQARAILPERADRYRQAALVMNELGLREESETLFRHALALEPEGILYFAKALVRWGRFADAVMLLEPRTRGCMAERLYAQALAQVGRHQTAADAYASALGICGAKDWTLRVGLAKARLYSGDSRGADVVESLLEERPEAHGLRRAWLWVLSTRGRTVDAVRHLEHLKWAGVIRPPEEAALERARIGLPFSLPSLAPSH
mgnify:CR=1 FL=1